LKVTLREIARYARVHESTASTVLNGARGSTRVSEETRRRVLEAAHTLGYTVNRAAQQLKTRRSRVVGLLTGGIENPFFARLVAVCSEALEREGYDVILATRRTDETTDLHLLQALVSRGLDGVLLWNETLTEVRDRIRQPDMRNTVVMGYRIPERDCVAATLHVGVQEALEHLRKGGRQRIGYLAPKVALKRQGDPRHDIYCAAMEAWGCPARVYAFDGPAFDAGSARRRAEQIAAEEDLPDALFCFNDMVAIGALAGLRRKGLRVPADVALVGCDDLPLAAELDVPLTSIHYPLAELSQLAVSMLLERIGVHEAAGELPAARLVELPVTLRIRASSLT
jgi:LacI family transcriptional regulator